MEVTEIQPAPMNCDRIAPFYETLEHLSFGRSLERRRFAFLREARYAQHAILCGGGDGRFLTRLLAENPRVEVDFVELSPKMVEVAERRVKGMGRAFWRRVRFHAGDVRAFAAPPRSYDLIATHFFLDCFTPRELTEIVATLAKCGQPGSRWMVSEFREAEGVLANFWTRAVIRGLYGGFRWTTGLRARRIPNYDAALAVEGYVLCCEEQSLGGLLRSSLWKKSSRKSPQQ